MDSNMCSCHTNMNYRILHGYANNENLNNVINYDNNKGASYNLNTGSNFYVPASGISSSNSSGNLNSGNNYATYGELLNSYTSLEQTLNKCVPNFHINSLSNNMICHKCNTDQGNNLNFSQHGFFEGFTSNGLMKTYNKNNRSCIHCSCLGPGADNNGSALGLDISNKISGPLTGYGVYSAMGGTHPSASASSALLNQGLVNHPEKNGNISFNASENLNSETSSTLRNGISNSLNCDLSESASNHISGYFCRNATSQIGNPIGQVSNPLGQINNPIGQVNNPIGQIGNPIGQIGNQIGHHFNNPISTHTLDTNEKNRSTNSLQVVRENLNKNGEVTTYTRNGVYNSFDFLNPNNLNSTHIKTPFNYSTLNGFMLNNMKTSNGKNAEMNMKTASVAKNSTSGSFNSDENSLQPLDIGFTRDGECTNTIPLNSGRISNGIPSISMSSPNPNIATRTSYMRTPITYVTTPVTCMNNRNAEINSASRGKLNMNALGTTYPETERTMREIEKKDVMYKKGVNIPRSLTSDEGVYNFLRLNNQQVPTIFPCAMSMESMGSSLRTSNIHPIGGRISHTGRIGHMGRISHMGGINHTGRICHRDGSGNTRESGNAKGSLSNQSVESTKQKIYNTSKMERIIPQSMNLERDVYNIHSLDSDLMYGSNQKSCTSRSREIKRRCNPEEKNITSWMNRPIDRKKNLNECKILNKRSYDFYYMNTNESYEENNNFHNINYAEKVKKTNTHLNSKNRNTNRDNSISSRESNQSSTRSHQMKKSHKKCNENRKRKRRKNINSSGYFNIQNDISDPHCSFNTGVCAPSMSLSASFSSTSCDKSSRASSNLSDSSDSSDLSNSPNSPNSSNSSFFTNTLNEKVNKREKEKQRKGRNQKKKKKRKKKKKKKKKKKRTMMLTVPHVQGKRRRPTVIEFLNSKWNRSSYNKVGSGGQIEGQCEDERESCSLSNSGDFSKKEKKIGSHHEKKKRGNHNLEDPWKGMDDINRKKNSLSSNSDHNAGGSTWSEGDSNYGNECMPWSEERKMVQENTLDNRVGGSGGNPKENLLSIELNMKTRKKRTRKCNDEQDSICTKMKRLNETPIKIKDDGRSGERKSDDGAKDSDRDSDKVSDRDSDKVSDRDSDRDIDRDSDGGIEKNRGPVNERPTEGAEMVQSSEENNSEKEFTSEGEELYANLSSSNDSDKTGDSNSADLDTSQANIQVGEEEMESESECEEMKEKMWHEESTLREKDTKMVMKNKKKKKKKQVKELEEGKKIKPELSMSGEREEDNSKEILREDQSVESSSSGKSTTSDTEGSTIESYKSESDISCESSGESSEDLLDYSSDEITRTESSSNGSGNHDLHADEIGSVRSSRSGRSGRSSRSGRSGRSSRSGRSGRSSRNGKRDRSSRSISSTDVRSPPNGHPESAKERKHKNEEMSSWNVQLEEEFSTCAFIPAPICSTEGRSVNLFSERESKRREAYAKKREAEAKKREAEAKKREAEAKKREAEAKKREAEANRIYREILRKDGIKCYQTERELKRKEKNNNEEKHGRGSEDNNTCIIKQNKRAYTSLRNVDYVNNNEILRMIKKDIIKKNKIKIYEYIILLSYLFYKKSRYLDFNKIYLYNTMKKLCPFLLKINKKCNDVEVRNVFYYLSKIFILDDYFIFRINIFAFNWFILYVYKMKLKNVLFIEDINLLTNFLCGFLTNKKFKNYSILFLINVVLQKATGKSLYAGLNYSYICSLYISLFSKAICMSVMHREFLRTYPRHGDNNTVRVMKHIPEESVKSWVRECTETLDGSEMCKDGKNENNNQRGEDNDLDNGESNEGWRQPCRSFLKMKGFITPLNTNGTRCMNRINKTNMYSFSRRIIQNNEQWGDGKNWKKQRSKSEKISTRQDLIILYILYICRNNCSIYVNILKHILDDILKFKLTYNFHKIKIKSRFFYKKIVRCLKNVKKIMVKLGKKRYRRRNKERASQEIDKQESEHEKKRGRKKKIKPEKDVKKWNNLSAKEKCPKEDYTSFDDHANTNYSFVYLLVGLFLEYTSFSFNGFIMRFFENEKLANLYKLLILHVRDYTEIIFKYMKFITMDMTKVYGNIWIRNIFTTVNLKKVDEFNDIAGTLLHADGFRHSASAKRGSERTSNTAIATAIATATATTTATSTAAITQEKQTSQAEVTLGRTDPTEHEEEAHLVTQQKEEKFDLKFQRNNEKLINCIKEENIMKSISHTIQMENLSENRQEELCYYSLNKANFGEGNEKRAEFEMTKMEHFRLNSKVKGRKQEWGNKFQSIIFKHEMDKGNNAKCVDKSVTGNVKVKNVKVNNVWFNKSDKRHLSMSLKKKRKKNEYYGNDDFIEATLYMLCRCVKIFKGSTTLRTLFDILFLFFIQRMERERLQQFLGQMYNKDMELSRLITNILLRTDMRENCLQNVSFINYFLTSKESLEPKHIGFNKVEIDLADICSFYLNKRIRCRVKRKIPNRRIDTNKKRKNEKNYFNSQLCLKPCSCMFLTYVLFFSRIFKNFKMYFMHFTRFSYSLQKKAVTMKDNTKMDFKCGKIQACIEGKEALQIEKGYLDNHTGFRNYYSRLQDSEQNQENQENQEEWDQESVEAHYNHIYCKNCDRDAFSDECTLGGEKTSNLWATKMKQIPMHVEDGTAVITNSSAVGSAAVANPDATEILVDANVSQNTIGEEKKCKRSDELELIWKEHKEKMQHDWKNTKWKWRIEEVLRKYHLIISDEIKSSYFVKGLKKCSRFCKKRKQKKVTQIFTKLENVKISENNSIGNVHLFSEHTAYHILSILYEQQGVHNVQLNNVFVRINGNIFDGREMLGAREMHDGREMLGEREMPDKGEIFCEREMHGKGEIPDGKVKSKRNGGKILRHSSEKGRICERIGKIMNNILKWNKLNIAYNKRKKEEKKKANLKRRRNKYTNIIVDMYPLIFLSLTKLLNASIIINDDVKDKCFDVKNEIFPIKLNLSVELNKYEESLKIHQTEIKNDERTKWQYPLIKKCLCTGCMFRVRLGRGASSWLKYKGANGEAKPESTRAMKTEAASPSRHLLRNIAEEGRPRTTVQLLMGRRNKILNLIVKLLYREIKTDFYMLNEYYDEKVHIYRTLLILLMLKYLSSGHDLSAFGKKFILFFIQRLFRLLCFRLMCLFLSAPHVNKLTSEIIIIDDDYLVNSYLTQSKSKRTHRKSIQNRLFQKKSYNLYKRYSENFLFNIRFFQNEGEAVSSAKKNGTPMREAEKWARSEDQTGSSSCNWEDKRRGKDCNKPCCKRSVKSSATSPEKLKKRTIYKPFVPFGSLVMTKKEILKLKLQGEEEIKKDNIYINKCILKSKAKSRSKNAEMYNERQIDEKEKIQLSVVSIILLMNVFRRNSNYSYSINFYINLLIEKFLEKKKYIHVDDHYFINNYLVKVVNPLHMNHKKEFWINENNCAKRKMQLINSGYKFYASSYKFPIFEFIFYESLKVYLCFIHKNSLGTFISKISRFNNMYCCINKNLHFKMKMNNLLCSKLNNLLIEELLNMRLNKMLSNCNSILSACMFFFISMLDEEENAHLAMSIGRDHALVGEVGELGEVRELGEVGEVRELGEVQELYLEKQWNRSANKNVPWMNSRNWEEGAVENSHKWKFGENENYAFLAKEEMNMEKCRSDNEPNQMLNKTVSSIHNCNNMGETYNRNDKENKTSNVVYSHEQRYYMNDKRPNRLVVGNCRNYYIKEDSTELINMHKSIRTNENKNIMMYSKNDKERNEQLFNVPTNENIVNPSSSHTTVKRITKYRIEYYHKEKGKNNSVKSSYIYMKPKDVHKLFNSFEMINKTILECTNFIYKLYFSNNKDSLASDEKEKRNRNVYTWFQNCLNVFHFETWVVHQFYNKFDNASCIYMLKKKKKKKELTTDVIHMDSCILRDIAKMKKHLENRFNDVKKVYNMDILMANEKKEPSMIKEHTSKLDAQKETKQPGQIEAETVLHSNVNNTNAEDKYDELIEDYDELNSFLDFSQDKSSGILLHGTNARAVKSSAQDGIQNLNEYKVDDGWLTYIRSLI
ncbi:hypothetical protein, conserved [Plasmodium gonderi]|uniref:Uncharacterized protein n=1 Tax=Plasmodium gonderi TaxID=77519 RepID=A0A1Y1JHR5_PLAGO|nr:hypothetical protein, conserved [Plasmodium gonderi]GAW80767.1 hypothetical protein, conserved [Plasmodium gonderi]